MGDCSRLASITGICIPTPCCCLQNDTRWASNQRRGKKRHRCRGHSPKHVIAKSAFSCFALEENFFACPKLKLNFGDGGEWPRAHSDFDQKSSRGAEPSPRKDDADQ